MPTDDDNDDAYYGDDYEHDEEYQNGHNLANFQARSLIFCMVIDLDNKG